jgi:hypothetical protein
MTLKDRVSTFGLIGSPRPFTGPGCQCLIDFFKEEFQKHHRCLEEHREYYSELAIKQAEEALGKVLQQMDTLSRREDACEVVGQLLRKFDSVTKLSALSEPRRFH